MAKIDCIQNAGALLGECPRWHPQERLVYWTDIDGRMLWRVGVDGSAAQSVRMPAKVGCFAFRESGGMVLAMEDGIYAGDPFVDVAALQQLCPHPDPQFASEGGRFNDGRCDAQGRFYAGTLDPARNKRGALYCLEPGADQARLIQEGFNTFNGLAFSPAGDEAWYADSPSRSVFRSSYDAATGGFGPRELVVEFDVEAPPRPDGACFAADGSYWCAMYAGAGVLVISRQGEVVRRFDDFPATYTTMVAFAGDDLDIPVVTTGQREDDPDEARRNPQCGGLFRIDGAGAAGVVDPFFAG